MTPQASKRATSNLLFGLIRNQSSCSIFKVVAIAVISPTFLYVPTALCITAIM